MRRSRRGTVLIMVVSILALLFVIVTGFLTLARFGRQAQEDSLRSGEAERVAESVNQVIRSAVREQWRDPNSGELLGGKNPRAYRYPDIPGAGKSGFQAAIDPVWQPPVLLPNDPNYPVNLPQQFERLRPIRYPAVTQLDPNLPREQPWLIDMLRDVNPNLPAFGGGDVVGTARYPEMDADGDGVPDNLYRISAWATDMANAMGGATVRTPRGEMFGGQYFPFRSSHIRTGTGTLENQWVHFDQFSRFSVATRVVPHGGKISLAVAGGATSWNYQFSAGMFNLVKRDGAVGQSGLTTSPNDVALLNEVGTMADAIEPLLSRRGGLLPSWAPENAAGVRDPNFARIPEPLRILERRFPRTFDVGRGSGLTGGANRPGSYQRFSIASTATAGADAGLIPWLAAARMNPLRYNLPNPPDPSDNPANYDVRHTLTAVSHSDNLARRLKADPANTVPTPLGLRHGATKFYLGDIAGSSDQAPNDPTRPLGAFDALGRFRGYGPPAASDPNLVHPDNRGLAIVREIADYYRDMIEAYNFSANDPNEELSADEQAYHLAVNTVAFAAPRGANGIIDNVVYESPVTGQSYIGYVPQPFISQAAIYNEETDPAAPKRIALLVELYNPNDRLIPGAGSDGHALNLSQFVITLNDNNPNNPALETIVPLDAPTDPAKQQIVPPQTAPYLGLPGRSFMSIAINGSQSVAGVGSTAFNNLGSNTNFVNDVPVNLAGLSDESLTIRLWRRGNPTIPSGLVWYVVDEFQMEIPLSQQTDTNGDSNFHLVAWRDMNTEPYFGPAPAILAQNARWRMAVAFDPTDSTEYKDERGFGNPSSLPFGSNGTSLAQSVNSAEPDLGAARFGPTIPLHLMNATPLALLERNKLNVHGANRPESFPTPGFLAFVPRFAHTTNPAAGTPGKPMSRTLRDAWEKQGHSVSSYPADFGHMPIFTNKQTVKTASVIKDMGEVPWGQLVFDYFTTINPRGNDNITGTSDDIDPLKVPGLINVNAAPWNVLMNLPVLGPAPGPGQVIKTNQGIGPQTAAPAFWSADAGILFGYDRDPALSRPRFIADPNMLAGVTVPDQNRALPRQIVPSGPGAWIRLGPWLAQSLAAYRDGLPYVDPTVPANYGFRPYFVSAGRNSGSAPYVPYRDTATYGTVRPAQNAGLSTLGEIANVMGFDSTAPQSLMGGSADMNAVLGSPASGAPRHGDFMRAAALFAMLDSHWLTTRNNTFTIYTTVTDRTDPEKSLRTQQTIDRSNLLPRQLKRNANGVLLPVPIVVQEGQMPDVIAERKVGYYNARYDD